MKRICCLAILVATVSAFSSGTPHVAAQEMGYNQGLDFGYGFGVGRDYVRGMKGIGRINRFNRGFRFNDFTFNRFNPRIEEPPYFALFPPVYYSSEIVRRPMGVSPFAAPPGIVPVEMSAAPQATTVVNPYYNRTQEKTQKVKDQSSDESTSDSDT